MTRQAGNLPAELSSFVNRRQERAELKRLLSASRLVTITGVGGVGKTRTALRVAAEVRRAFPDGVWWVDLSALAPGLLAHAVAEAVGVHDQTARPQLDVLAEYLAERRLLLVLDTCEHLVDACAELVSVVLRAAPAVQILATSRQPLGSPGEQLLPIAPLEVPQVEGFDGNGGPSGSPGLELFLERAQAAHAGFAVNEANRAAIAALCRRLDGIPLAIELAAARLRTMPAEQLLARWDAHLHLLTGPGRTDPARHETMHAAISWSHKLCTPAERLLWARVSVFAGGFDLADVEAVCADDRLPANGMVDVVAGLVDKSILLCDERAGAVRYRLLNTLREYGAELLAAAFDRDALRRRHRDHYLRLARRFDAQWCGPDQIAWSERLRAEHADLRAALDYCLAHPAEHQAGLELAGALRYFWVGCGFLREGRHYLDRLLALDPTPGPALTTALWTGAYVAMVQGDLAAVDARIAQCRPYAEAQGDPVAAAWMVFNAAAATLFRGDLEGAAVLGEQAASLHRSGGDAGMGLMAALGVLAMAFAHGGDPDRAIAVTRDLRETCDRYGERWMRSYADYYRSVAEVARGDPGAATTYAREALRFKRQLGDSLGIATALDVLACATGVLGEADRAARLLGVAHQVWRTFGLPQFGAAGLIAARYRCERQARDALGDERYEAAFADGQRLDLDAALAYALDERPDPEPAGPRGPSSWAPLTRRERDAAELVADGLTNAQIADRLYISHRTVAAHIEHILTKLDLANRAQIAAWVTQRGLAAADADRSQR